MERILICAVMWCCVFAASAEIPPRDRRIGRQGELYLLNGGSLTDGTKEGMQAADAYDNMLLSSGFSSEGKLRRVGSQATAPLKSIGSPHIPVVLVQFSDLKFSVANTLPAINNYYYKFCNGNMNGTRYTGTKNYGSVRDYFIEQSDSLFLPEFEIIGPVTLDSAYAYYGRNSGARRDVNISTFFNQSVAKAKAQYSGWDKFDNDGDGTVDMVFFIYAGEGENAQTDPNTIWPKEMLTSAVISGTKISCYAACNELYGNEADGIGVMCHEMSHALGLPDLYDTSNDNYGLDYWDLMDSGCYCDNAFYPCGYSSYEKDFMGWKQLEQLEYNKEYALRLLPLSEGGSGYKIVNSENSNEYYVLENRQNTGWDTYIARGTRDSKRHGMLVMHVDYLPSRWRSNIVNVNYAHQYLTIVPADDELMSYTVVDTDSDYSKWVLSAQGDPFPGRTGRKTLFSNEQPVYTASGYLRQPITNIVEHDDGTITLNVCKFADVDGNGKADTQDVLNIYDYIRNAGMSQPYVPQDVNMDGSVDTQDVLGVYEYILKE